MLSFKAKPVKLSETSFRVSVPVLSLHIVVADPMVSQAESLRTYNGAYELNACASNLISRDYQQILKFSPPYQGFVCHHFPH